MAPKLFRGIDFALATKRRAEAFVVDDGEVLQAVSQASSKENLAAVDCPLGTTSGFVDLLAGRDPEASEDGFQARRTEHWARCHLSKYRTVKGSNLRSSGGKRVLYFHPTSHAQPAAAMRTIPACLDFILTELSLHGEGPEARLQALSAARRGEGRFVEAHPRLFMYSALERVHRVEHGSCGRDILLAATTYKRGTKRVSAKKRSCIYAFLVENPVWMGSQRRRLEPLEAPDWLIDNDHNFDAWLCALTAWAHDHSETLDWRAAGIPEEIVDIEGHMLLLST